MRGTFEDNQFLWARGLGVKLANSRKPRDIAGTKIVAGCDDEFSTFHFLRLIVTSPGSEKDQAINLTWLGLNRRIARGGGSHASADDRHGRRARLPQVADRGEHVEVEWGTERIGLTW